MSIFLEISLLIWMKLSMLSQPVGVLKVMLSVFCTSTIQGKELCWHDFIKYMINIVLCWDICEPICFKLGMVLYMTKLYTLIPVWMTLMFTQGHRKAGIVQSVCCKVAWSNSNVHDYWLWKGSDCEKVLYGDYGSFEHLLFLFPSNVTFMCNVAGCVRFPVHTMFL